MNSLTVSDLALAPFVVEEISADRHELCLEKVSELAAELSPSLSEVERLWEVDAVGDVEGEGDGRLASGADILRKVNHLIQFPDSSLPDVRVPLALVTVVDLLARVNQLQLELDAVGWDRLVCINVDGADDGVVGIEGARVTFKDDGHGSAI